MEHLRFYRYFLGLRPDPRWFPLFQWIGEVLGLRIRLDLLHLTLCVVGETAKRDRFVRRRINSALDGQQLHSFAVNLSRVQAGPRGAYARSVGRQDEIQDFFRLLINLLRLRGIEPLHRKSGLHPHVTLGHRRCDTELLKIALQWFPAELLLIESEVGLTRHNVLGSWPLLSPRQPPLPLDSPTPSVRCAS
jgi:2'-5' RNA ligase